MISSLFFSIDTVVAAKDNWIENETFVTGNVIDSRAEVAGGCLMSSGATDGSSVASCFTSTSMHVTAGISSIMVDSGCVATRANGSASPGIGSGEVTCADMTVGAGGGNMSAALVLIFFTHLC